MIADNAPEKKQNEDDVAEEQRSLKDINIEVATTLSTPNQRLKY